MTAPELSLVARAYAMLESDDTLWAGVLFAHGDHFTTGLTWPTSAVSADRYDGVVRHRRRSRGHPVVHGAV